jgi:CRISPR-associated endonuclease Csn1
MNEYFVFPNPKTGFDPQEIDLTDKANFDRISPNLYRVQKVSSKDYSFRHHLDTTVDEAKELQETTWKRITSLKKLEGVVKVRVNHIGEIVAVGEY